MASETSDRTSREEILDHVRAHPGAGPSQIAEVFDVHSSTARYHLRRLVRRGALVRERAGRELHYYPTGAGWCEGARTVHARLTPAARTTLSIALKQGVVTRRTVVEKGHTRSASRWAFKRLVSAEVLERLAWGVYALGEEMQPCVRAALAQRPCLGCNQRTAQRRYPTSNPSPSGRIEVSSSR